MNPSLRLLGPPAVWVGGEWQLLPVQKPTLLLLYLATRGVWVERSALCSLFFSEGTLEAGRLSLRQLISRARRTEWAASLEVEGDRLRFRISTDLSQFREHLAGERWNAALEMKHPKIHPLLLEGMHGSPEFLNWLELERLELGEQTQEAFLGQALQHCDAKQFERAMHTLEPLLKTPETIIRRDLMALYLRSALQCGQNAVALEHFTAYSTRQLEQCGTLPDGDVLALIHCLKHGWPLGRAQVSLQRGPGSGTPLLGRDLVVIQWQSALERPHRRLSLWGGAGMGKTRLVLELAFRLEEQGKTVCYVDALHLQYWDLEFWTPRVKGLNSHSPLLILDHAPGGEDSIAHLLERYPTLQVLTVGREIQQKADFTLELTGLSGEAALHLLERTQSPVHLGELSPEQNLEQKKMLGSEKSAYPALVLELCGSMGLTLPSSLNPTPLESCFETLWTRLSEDEKKALEVLSHFQEGCSAETAQALGISKPLLLRLERLCLLHAYRGGWLKPHPSFSGWVLERVLERGPSVQRALERQHFFHFVRKLGQGESLMGGLQTWQHLVELDHEQVSLNRALRWGLHNAREREVEQASEGYLFGHSFYSLLEGGPESLPSTINSFLEEGAESALSAETHLSLERMRLRLGLFQAGLTPQKEGESWVRRAAQHLLELNAFKDAALAWGFLALLEWNGNRSAALELAMSLTARPLPPLEGTFPQQTLSLTHWLEALPSASSEPRFKSWTRYLVQLTHGHLARREGAFTAAREAYGYALECSETLEHPGALAWAQLHSGKAYLLEDNWFEAVGCLGLALEAGRRMVAPYLTLEALEGLVDAHTLKPLASAQARQVASELERQKVWPLRSAAFYSKASGLLERMKLGVEGWVRD